MKSFFFTHFSSHRTVFRQNPVSFLGFNIKQFKFANISNLHVNQHRGYVRRQSCLHCQLASKHIINPVVTREAPLELSKEAAKEGEANREGIFPKCKILTWNPIIELGNSRAQSPIKY